MGIFQNTSLNLTKIHWNGQLLARKDLDGKVGSVLCLEKRLITVLYDCHQAMITKSNSGFKLAFYWKRIGFIIGS